MENAIALQIAFGLVSSLAPHCKIIHIAGSVRRLKPEVKDIEIVCLPKMDSFDDIDIFCVHPKHKTVREFNDAVMQMGKVLKGHTNGRYMQILLPEGINLDLFMPDENDYYRQLAIRTGPAEYSYSAIAIGWRKIGWCGTKDGLRLMTDCQDQKQCSGKSTWHCINPTPELPPVWKSEREFFDWIKVPWLEPAQRG